MSLAFADGNHNWENNSGNNWSVPVRNLKQKEGQGPSLRQAIKVTHMHAYVALPGLPCLRRPPASQPATANFPLKGAPYFVWWSAVYCQMKC